MSSSSDPVNSGGKCTLKVSCLLTKLTHAPYGVNSYKKNAGQQNGETKNTCGQATWGDGALWPTIKAGGRYLYRTPPQPTNSISEQQEQHEIRSWSAEDDIASTRHLQPRRSHGLIPYSKGLMQRSYSLLHGVFHRQRHQFLSLYKKSGEDWEQKSSHVP